MNKGSKLRVVSAVCTPLAIALSIYCFIDGDTILECIILLGLGMFMAFVAITGGPTKRNSN